MLGSGETKMAGDGRFLPGVLGDLPGALGKGSCFCPYPVFKAFYRIVEQEGQPGYLILCTLADGNGQPLANGKLAEWSERLAEAIEASIPRWGAACQYGMGQYLLLLADTEKEECEEVERRIDRIFLDTCPGGRIRWEMNRAAPAEFTGQERRRSGKAAGNLLPGVQNRYFAAWGQSRKIESGKEAEEDRGRENIYGKYL